MTVQRPTLLSFLSFLLLAGCDEPIEELTPEEFEQHTDDERPLPDELIDPDAPVPDEEGPVPSHEPNDLVAEQDWSEGDPSRVSTTISPAPFCNGNDACGPQQRCDDNGPLSDGCVDRCSSDDQCRIGEECSANSGFCEILEKGDWNFCKNGGCERGHGDCDDDSECEGALSCMTDIGTSWGYFPDTDVCDYPAGHGSYCSAQHPCGSGQGDCDLTSQCGFGLICKENRGGDFGFASWVDVCLPLWG